MNRITAPGLYDLTAEAYHADPCPAPSLSASIACTLLDRSPLHAWTGHPRLNPAFERTEEAKFDFGSACHRILLGKGADLAVIEADDWRTKAAKEARDKARDAGRIPIKVADNKRAIEMVAAFWRHVAGFHEHVSTVFLSEESRSETMIAWREGSAWCRSLVDRMLETPDAIILADYKTTAASGSPAAFGRRLFDLGYDLKMAFYRRGLRTVFDGKPVHGLLYCQETTPPYALSVVELSDAAWDLADRKASAAIALWQRCMALTPGQSWPGYPPLVATAEVPPWIEQQWLEREINDDAINSAITDGMAPPDWVERLADEFVGG